MDIRELILPDDVIEEIVSQGIFAEDQEEAEYLMTQKLLKAQVREVVRWLRLRASPVVCYDEGRWTDIKRVGIPNKDWDNLLSILTPDD